MGTQLELFEALERKMWRQLPEEARDDLVARLAGLLLECVEGGPGVEGEVGDDR